MNNITENQTEILEKVYDYYWFDLYNNHEYLEQILINMNNQDDLEC
jgi:hypothetical protein